MAKLKGKKIGKGIIYYNDSLKLIQSKEFLRRYKGKIDLIFTSPPFPLNNQKAYGNRKGNDYIFVYTFFPNDIIYVFHYIFHTIIVQLLRVLHYF